MAVRCCDWELTLLLVMEKLWQSMAPTEKHSKRAPQCANCSICVLMQVVCEVPSAEHACKDML